jgi:tetratricopeptide (TPR) repeat protein
MSKISYFAFTIVAASLLAVGYYYLTEPPIANSEKNLNKSLKSASQKTSKQEGEEIEDEGEDESGNESEDDADATVNVNENEVKQKSSSDPPSTVATESSREAYESAVNLGIKLIKGEAYERAAAKFTEAIDLASSIKPAHKDVLTLYNNRSAAYERLKRFDEALSDISVVLALDSKHVKVRGRRARILESQGKLTESLNELVVIMTIETQFNGGQPTVAQKIDELNRMISGIQADEHMSALRSGKGRDLPTKSYCRTFLDLFPSHYQLKEKLKKVDKALLQTKVNDADSVEDKIAAIADLTWKDIIDGNISDGFKSLESYLPTLVSTEEEKCLSPQARSNLSRLYDLFGSSFHLRCNFHRAIPSLEKALSLDSGNFEAALKLASIDLELGELEKSEKRLTDLCSTQSSENLAWCLVHRASLWSTRDKSGGYRSDAISLALSDIDKALHLTG